MPKSLNPLPSPLKDNNLLVIDSPVLSPLTLSSSSPQTITTTTHNDYDQVSDTPRYHCWLAAASAAAAAEAAVAKASATAKAAAAAAATAAENKDTCQHDTVNSIPLQLYCLTKELERQSSQINYHYPPPLLLPPSALSLPLSSPSSLLPSLAEQLNIFHTHLMDLQLKIDEDNKILLMQQNPCWAHIHEVNILKDCSETTTTTTTLQENIYRLFKKAKVPQCWIISIDVDLTSAISTAAAAAAATAATAVATATSATADNEADCDNYTVKTPQNVELYESCTIEEEEEEEEAAKVDNKENEEEEEERERPKENKQAYTAVFVYFINGYVKARAIQMLNTFLRENQQLYLDDNHDDDDENDCDCKNDIYVDDNCD